MSSTAAAARRSPRGCAARPRWWRRRVQLVAIDMSSEFRAADPHGAAQGEDQRRPLARRAPRERDGHQGPPAPRVGDLHQRRGRIIDTPWKYRKLLTCAGDRLSVRQRARLTEILDAGHRTRRRVGHQGDTSASCCAARDTASFQREWARLEHAVQGDPPARAGRAVQDPHRVAPGAADLLPHAGHERSYRGSEPRPRRRSSGSGRGYRNHDNYRCRIIGYAPRQIAA